MIIMSSVKICVVLVGLLVAACSSAEAGKIPHCPNNCTVHQIHMATGQEDGTYYKIGQALTEALRKEPNSLGADANSIGFVPTQGSIENLKQVQSNPSWLGIVQSDVLHYRRWQDVNKPSGDANSSDPNDRIIGVMYREPVYILVRRKLRLSSIEELRGKKVAIGEPNSGTRFTSEIILGMFGISLDELELCEPNYLETERLFAREAIDAAFIVSAGIPEPIIPVFENKSVHCLKMDRNDLIRIASVHPNLYTLLDVNNPAHDVNDRQNDKEEFRTISVTSILIANYKIDPDTVVGTLAKLLCSERNERLPRFVKHSENSAIDPNVVRELKNLKWVKYPFLLKWVKQKSLLYRKFRTSAPFHEAASKYYNGEGYWLIKEYRRCTVQRFWFPSLLVVYLIFIFFGLKRDKWPRWVQDRIWVRYVIYIIGIYSFIIILSYIALYSFESGVGNPDMTGEFGDLVTVFMLYFKLGEVACITEGGKIVRGLTLLAGTGFGIGMLGKLGGSFVDKKIREVFKMFPKNSHDHVVICNWTSKVGGVIRQLRSKAIRRRRIIIIAPPAPNIPDKLPEYDVYIVHQDPTDEEILKDKDLNISGAHAILILADEEHSDSPDRRSLKILGSISSVLESKRKNIQSEGNVKGRNIVVEMLLEVWRSVKRVRKARKEGIRKKADTKKPRIIVELLKRVYEDSMRVAGADEVVSYSDIKHKLLAQAIITPGAINVVQEILTAEENSNEVYNLEISKVVKKLLEDIEGECTFRKFTEGILKEYAEKKEIGECPITIIGVRSEGQLHINPKDEQFRKIKKDKIDAAVVLAWKEPGKLKM